MQGQDTTPSEQQAHTPGPMHRAWSNAPLHRYGLVIAKSYDEDDREIGFVYGQDDEAVANAELWMAAPQMLAALFNLTEAHDCRHRYPFDCKHCLDECDCIEDGHKAIAAARGGAS